MITLDIKKLAEICRVDFDPRCNSEISSVCIDSRKVTSGSVFFAIKGENHDGHDYLKQVFESGAACAVISDRSKSIPGKPVIFVADTITALGRLAKYVRQNSSYKVVAITGSAGKTSTKNMVSHVLKSKFKCYSSPKSFNNNIGVPLTIFDAPNDTEILVSELGSNHPGEIEYLTKIIEPDIAIVTSVLPAHLEGFGSLDVIKEEKVSIAKGLKTGGRFFVTDSLFDYCADGKIKFEPFCKSQKIKLGGYESSFEIEGVTVKLPLSGRANVENALAAWTVCKNLGISASQFADELATVKPVDMRMECLNIGSAKILADCYNANPGSMANALETLSLIAQQEKKRAVFIFGRMGELGNQSEFLHTQLGRDIVKYKVPVVLTIKGDCSKTAQTAHNTADYDISVEVFENLSQLCDNMYKFVKPDDIILIKASRSERYETVVEKLKVLFTG
ncbi:MAG: UDP-N-acetylmuramoyl-tripeptide--D-alanyl-D-alanine ligase [Planctomycetaceae bacterium]|nr:UDP-N-acetylmuramoyl-tripeptide--D-alanyl-D-alanine ligase [Planctomycetaceae bacterium]